jgi:signal transduction histidine kinase
MRTIPRRAVAPVALALTVLVAIGDWVTGVEITFTLLYLFPIAGATWLGGRRLGLACAAIAWACSTTIVYEIGPHRWLPLVWNAIGELAIFTSTAAMADALRRHVEREREERRLAVEQLRHGERLQVIGTMAAGVAHELGTPLGVIAGSAEFLETDQLEPARVRELGRMIGDQARRMTTIIRHLLEFGRRGGARRAEVDLDEIVGATVEMMGATARKHGVELRVTPSGSLVARVNASEIEQVLTNLVLNAVQASPAGGVVVVRASVRGDRAAIAIEDRGGGIAADALPRIFDPFFTTKGVGAGTGLGLSVSYGIVRDHGGAIEVESELGRGSVFTVLLPRDHANMR